MPWLHVAVYVAVFGATLYLLKSAADSFGRLGAFPGSSGYLLGLCLLVLFGMTLRSICEMWMWAVCLPIVAVALIVVELFSDRLLSAGVAALLDSFLLQIGIANDGWTIVNDWMTR